MSCVERLRVNFRSGTDVSKNFWLSKNLHIFFLGANVKTNHGINLKNIMLALTIKRNVLFYILTKGEAIRSLFAGFWEKIRMVPMGIEPMTFRV